MSNQGTAGFTLELLIVGSRRLGTNLIVGSRRPGTFMIKGVMLLTRWRQLGMLLIKVFGRVL